MLAGCASVKYSPLATEQKSIPHVSVTVSYKIDGIYQLQVHNKLHRSIILEWNSSAYVNTGGDAVRLIHIQDADSIPDEIPPNQMPTPVASSAKLKTYFVGESWIDYARRGVTPRPRDSEKKAKIYIAFNINGKRVYWTADVTFISVQ